VRAHLIGHEAACGREHRGDGLGDAVADGSGHRGKGDARDHGIGRGQAARGEKLRDLLGAAQLHHQARIVDGRSQACVEARAQLDGQQMRIDTHRVEKGAGGAAGARTQLDHAARLCQRRRPDQPLLQEPRARDDRAHLVGVLQEALEKGDVVAHRRQQAALGGARVQAQLAGCSAAGHAGAWGGLGSVSHNRLVAKCRAASRLRGSAGTFHSPGHCFIFRCRL
jgi:hypothetical protein